MKNILNAAFLVLALLLFVGCDRLTKTIAKDELSSSSRFSYFNGFLQLEYTENPGSFMSLGSNLPDNVRRTVHLLSAAVVLAGLVLVVVFIHRFDRARLAGLTLLLAGACGNLLDRFMNHGRVIDFIMIDIGRAHTGVFNIADVLIIMGAAILISKTRVWKEHEA